MKTLIFASLLLVANAHAVAPAEQAAQQAHARGSCGKLGPGTGLKDGKGWIVSMLPGRHQFRVKGGGNAYVTVARQTSLDFDAGRAYYIVIEGAPAGAVLEWKIPGSDWGPVAKYFLYPPQQ